MQNTQGMFDWPLEESELKANPRKTSLRFSRKINLRFADLQDKNIAAFVFDLDQTLTSDISEDIDHRALGMIACIRALGIPVIINSGRRYMDFQTQTHTRRDMLAVVEDMHAWLERNPLYNRREILAGLFISCEGGFYVYNGYAGGADQIIYEDEILKYHGIVRDRAREARLHNHFSTFIDKYDKKLFEGYIKKKYSLSLFCQSRSYRDKTRRALVKDLKRAGLWDDKQMKLFCGGRALDITFYPLDKSSVFVFLDKILDIRDNSTQAILTAGDSGQRGGNDYPMLAGRTGGLSTHQFDPRDPFMIPLPVISPYKAGFPCLLWAVRQLLIKAEK